MSCVCFLLLAVACNQYSPRPLAYPRIEKRQSDTVQYSNPAFVFSYPGDVLISRQSADASGEVWLNIKYPQFGATLYCTYLTIAPGQLTGILDDNHRLAYSHASKADAISQKAYDEPDGRKFGILYNIEGDVAVPIQFFVTDSLTNFYRGSLYYDGKVNPDSVAPVTEIIRQDIMYMIETLEWKNK